MLYREGHARDGEDVATPACCPMLAVVVNLVKCYGFSLAKHMTVPGVRCTVLCTAAANMFHKYDNILHKIR